MAEGLTFRFVFQDEGGSPPPEAAPGAAERARPTPQLESPPQPRPAPESFSPPSQPETQPPQPEQAQDDRQTPQPRRRPAKPQPTQPEGERPERQPRQPSNTPRREAAQPRAGEAERLIAEMVRHLSAVPGIGRSIGTLAHIVEPILQARRRLEQLAEQRQQTPVPSVRPVEARKPAQPGQPPAPSEQAAVRESSQPAPREPEPVTPEVVRENPDQRFQVKPFEPAPRQPAEVVHRVEVAQPAERTNPDQQFQVRPFERPEKKAAPEQQPAPRPPKESDKIPDSVGFREAFESFKGIGDSLKDSIWDSISSGKGIPKIEQKTILGSFTNAALNRGYTEKDQIYKAMELAAQISASKVTSTEKIAQLNEAINRHFPVKQPEPRKPEDSSLQQSQPREFKVAGPPDQQAAIEKLIAALGPLPASERELTAVLRPLKDLGFTLAELKQAVRDMRRRESEPAPRQPAQPAQPTAQPAAKPEAAQPAPRKSPFSQQHAQSVRTIRPVPPPASAPTTPAPAPRPPAPGPAAITPADIAPGAASAAADAVPAAAEAGAATAAVGAGALGGPAGIAAAIGVVAVAGTATRALGALGSAAQRVGRKFDEMTERLAPFNAELSAALANAQVRRTLADIDASHRLGADLARRSDAGSRIDAAVTKITAALSQPFLDRIATVTEVTAKAAEKISENSEFIAGAMNLFFTVQFPAVVLGLDALKKAIANARKNDPNLDPRADIMGIFGGQPGRLEVEGIDFGQVSNPIMPQPIRSNKTKPTRAQGVP